MSPWPPLSGAGFSDPDDASSAGEDGEGEADDPLRRPLDGQLERGGVIGRGGMGEVSAAHHLPLKRDVAVKRMAPGASEAWFLREAAITARLEHPAIVPIYAVGREGDGTPFYTMRLVRGATLHEVMELGETDPFALLRRVLVVFEAVAYAHAQGVVHRDIKPGNILLGDFGETWLVDWGLAAEVGTPGSPGVGTSGYRSPEQEAGEPAAATADVYSLGRVLQQLLADTEIPAEPRAILARATTSDPSARYPDGGALVADLRAWLDGRLVTAHDYTPGELLLWALRRWRLPIAGAVAVLVLVGLVAGSAAVRVARERDRALEAEVQATEQRQQAALNLSRSLAARARDAEREGRASESELLAAAALTWGESPVARGVLAGVLGRERPRLLGRVSQRCEQIVLSTDGRTTACRQREQVLWLDRDGEELGRLEERVHRVALTEGPRPRLVLLDNKEVVSTWTPEDGLEVVVRSGVPRHRQLWGVGPGHLAIMGNGEGRLLDLETGDNALVECDVGVRSAARTMAFDGPHRVAIACNHHPLESQADGAVQRWPHEGQDLAILARHQEVLFAGMVDGSVLIIDGEEERRIERLVDDTPTQLLASGALLALSASRGGVEVWRVHDETLLARIPAVAEDLAWLGPATLRIATAEGLEDWEIPLTVPADMAHESGIAGVDLSPDGGRAASAHGDGHVVLWDIDSGRALGTWRMGEGVAKDVAFQTDGRWLVAVSAEDEHPLRVDLGSLQPLEGPLAGTHRRIEALASGGFLALTYGHGPSVLFDLGGDSAPYSVDIPHNPLESQSTPDGRTVVLLDRVGGMFRFDHESRSHQHLFTDNEADAIAPLEGTVVYARYDRVIEVMAGSDETRQLGRATGQIVDLDTSEAAGLVAAGTSDGHVALIHREGGLAAQLLAHAGRVSQVRFSRDGSTLVSASWDGRVRTWDLRALTADPPTLLAEAEERWGREAVTLTGD